MLLTTPNAAAALGVSACTLKRYASSGLLHEGVHFFRGAYTNSPWRWNAERVRESLWPSYTQA